MSRGSAWSPSLELRRDGGGSLLPGIGASAPSLPSPFGSIAGSVRVSVTRTDNGDATVIAGGIDFNGGVPPFNQPPQQQQQQQQQGGAGGGVAPAPIPGGASPFGFGF